jgi:polar amino acid transport system permease protein
MYWDWTAQVQWDWGFVEEIMPRLLDGFKLTVLATVLASALSLVLGLAIALVKRSPRRFVSMPMYGATEFIRRTPLLVQLYFIFYVLPTLGITLAPLAAGVIGLGVHYSTYTSEIYRGGIDSVHRGQWDAATALNFPRVRVWRNVILPQAIPGILPALGNTVIAMFKETALLSAITVQELLGVGREIGAETYDTFEPLTIAAVLYFAVSYPSSVLVRALERRVAHP